MPKNISKLLMTEPQADFLADTIEEGIEAAHDLTLEHEKDSEEYQYGADRMKALMALLSQFDEENPILSSGARPGHEFDWENFWEQAESEDVDEDDDVQDAELVEEDVAQVKSQTHTV